LYGGIRRFLTLSKTYMAKPGEVPRNWWIIDAKGKPLGRVASTAATILRGKHKPTFTPSVDMGDSVIIVNAKDVLLTGKKKEQKMYFTHSGYPGGDKYVPYKIMMEKYPERVVEHAVKGMLPKNRLGRQIGKRLFVYRGPNHPHQAQKPELWQGGI